MKAELPLYGCYIQSQKWAASNITHPSTPSSYPRGLEKHSIYLTLQQQLPVCKFDCQRLFIHCRLERWEWVIHAGKPPKKEPLFLYITSPPACSVYCLSVCVTMHTHTPPCVPLCVCVCVLKIDVMVCFVDDYCFVSCSAEPPAALTFSVSMPASSTRWTKSESPFALHATPLGKWGASRSESAFYKQHLLKNSQLTNEKMHAQLDDVLVFSVYCHWIVRVVIISMSSQCWLFCLSCDGHCTCTIILF